MFARRYRLIEPLTGPGEIEVWRADDVALGRPVAVTLLPAGQAPDPQDASVLDLGSDNGFTFVVRLLSEGNSTLVMPALDQPSGPAHARPRADAPAAPARAPRWLFPVVTGGLVVICLIVLVNIFSDAEPPPVKAEPSATSAAQNDQPSAPPARPKKAPPAATTPPPTPTPTPTSATPRGPMGMLVAFQRRLDAQTANGQFDPDTAKNVREHVSWIAQKLAQGKTEDIHGKLIDIRAKLRDAAREGKWTPDATAAQLLQRLLDTF